MIVAKPSRRESARLLPSYRRISAFRFALPLLAAITLGAAAVATAAALPDTPDRSFVTDGVVHAIVRAGDTVYIGGVFNRVGPRTGPGVEVSLDGAEKRGLPEVSGTGATDFGAATGLRAVVADGSGGWYISGYFSHVGGVARTNLAHIRADRSVDPAFSPALDGGVHALAVSGSTLYVAGPFTTIDGRSRNNIAAFNTDDGSLTAFNPDANAAVAALAPSSDGSLLYVGGAFTQIGGQPRSAVAALNVLDGSATTSFKPSLTGGVPNVSALALSGSILYVAGNFNLIDGLSRRAIAALSLGGANDGAVVTDFAPTPSYFSCIPCASVDALAVVGATVYVGGAFDAMGGQPRSNLAGLDAASGSATAFNPNPDANILALAASASTVYVGGGFRTIGGQARQYVAALDAVDGNAHAFDPSPNGTIGAIGVSDNAVYLGGLFSSIGGVQRNSIAAIRVADGTPTAWDPNPEGLNGGNATINALAVAGTTLYAGGFFSAIGNQARDNIAAVSTVDGRATSWNPSSDGVVSSIARAGDIVYVGGSFINIGGQQRVFIAALGAADGLATDWDPDADGTVEAIVTSGDLVYVGGFFLTIGGQSRGRLAALHAADGSATHWDPDLGPGMFGNYVRALALSGSTLYVGGGFVSVQGTPRNNVAGIHTDDGSATSFNPDASGDNSDGAVNALAVDGSIVYVGGDFQRIGGQPRNLLAALNASDGSATDFNPNGAEGYSVQALAVASDGTLYAGGSFPTFALAYQTGFASFTPLVPNDEIFRSGFEDAPAATD